MSMSLYARLARRHAPTPTSEQRRLFLQRSAALGAAMLLSGPFISCTNDRRSSPNLLSAEPRTTANPRRIAIIGAGFAGLACAYELHAIGHHITIYEARMRLGGRVLTDDHIVPGSRVEAGGELIGSNHPIWLAYASRFGLSFTEVTEPDDLDYPIVIDGRVLLERESLALYTQMERLASRLNRLARTVDPHTPWISRDAAALDARTLHDWIEQADATPLAKKAMHIQFSGDNAVPTERQSLLANLAAIAGGGYERFWTESEVYRCAQGNDQLAARLAEPLLAADAIRLASPVSAIARTPDDRMRITTSRGDQSLFDEVVLAVPPTLWDRITFQPPLPHGLAPQMGDASKQLFRVRGPFWEQDGLAAWSLGDGLYTWSWDATDGRLPAGADQTSPRCFTLFAGGGASARARAIEQHQRTDALLDDASRAYPNLRDAYLGTHMNMDWPSDPWTRGGYSMPAPGQLTAHGPSLREGLPGLRFSGEHCSTAFPGYMEGALESGVQTARRIAHASEARLAVP